MAKEYGKLTAEQFKGLIDVLPEVRKQGDDLRSLVRSVPKDRLDELLVTNYNWGALYEFSFYEYLALVCYGLNLHGYLRALAQAPDPQQQMLEDLRRDISDEIEEPRVKRQAVIGMVFSL